MDVGGFDDDGDFSNIPTRPMRIKILYTFDADNRTTCLARFPDTRNIPAVSIDEQSQVGIIDLQQCIHAVVAASPEIISALDMGDFTVYTFDYSEYDTPLLGQGRLSTLLSVSPSGDGNPTKVTGRVCKNVPALFSQGVKETLEVKLRFTPVPKAPQRVYGNNNGTAHTMSPATSAGFDPNAWNMSMHQTQTIQQSNGYFDYETVPMNAADDASSLEELLGIGSGSSADGSGLQATTGVGIPETPAESAFDFNPAFAAHSHSAPGSRAGSPMMGLDSSTRNDPLRHHSFSGQPMNIPEQSRPDSRASLRSESSTSRRHHRQASTQSHPGQSTQQQTEVFYNEDGHARKRTKVTQIDWRGRSQFGSRSADLRVTAATASSMHMHRPIHRRSTALGSNLEPPPRVPTPVPQRTTGPYQRVQQQSVSRSMLRDASTVDGDSPSDGEQMSEGVFSSPEASSPANSIGADGTPLDIPSSPPVFHNCPPNEPSSPALPSLPCPRLPDSGYMSELGFNRNDVMQSMEEDENQCPNVEDFELAGQYGMHDGQRQAFIKNEGSLAGSLSPRHGNPRTFQAEQPDNLQQLHGQTALSLSLHRTGSGEGYEKSSQDHQHALPSNIAMKYPASMGEERRASSTTRSEALRPGMLVRQASHPEMVQSRRGSLALPCKATTIGPAQGQTQGEAGPPDRKRQIYRRSYTANESEAGSPAPSDTEGRPRGLARSGSAVPRRKVIEQRLQASIARGDMPQFCKHCGAIETSTWRKLYVKEVLGKPGPLDSVEGEGETIGIEEVEKDEHTGAVTKFIIRKSMKKTKETQPGKNFEDVVVCNPCGLWFNKFRFMRPPEKWKRKPVTRRKKSNKDDEVFSTDGIEPQSEAFFTDQVGPEDAVDGPSPIDDSTLSASATVEDGAVAPGRRPRAHSMQPQPLRRTSGGSDSSALEADARAIQSSPVRFQGSQDSPIEVDLTPQPTRRLLFPSPRHSGELKSLGDAQTKSRKSASSFIAEKLAASETTPTAGATSFNVLKVFTYDKENVAPPLGDDDDGLAHLFDGSPGAAFKTPIPKTPRSQLKSGDILKTPTPSSRKRKALSPNLNALNNADVLDALTSPAGSRYFLRSTPSRLERTPGGRNNSGGGLGAEPSPFSRHLMNMLSDTNDHGGHAPFTSPSRQYDFSDLPTFTTPGKDMDWKGIDDILSSEFASYEEAPGEGVNDQSHGNEGAISRR